jgi:diadenosine tetraphosphate (Ap4A) HIT family hydrolase
LNDSTQTTPQCDPKLNPELEGDTHRMGRWTDSLLLLHRDAALPWFILVPRTEERMLHRLPVEQRDALSRRCDALAAFIESHWRCDRINQAAIGNRVPQLHLHVVGRREDDPCWPGVVWGRLKSGLSYGDDEVDSLRRTLATELGLDLS